MGLKVLEKGEGVRLTKFEAMASNLPPTASHRMAMILEDVPTTSMFQPMFQPGFNKRAHPGFNIVYPQHLQTS